MPRPHHFEGASSPAADRRSSYDDLLVIYNYAVDFNTDTDTQTGTDTGTETDLGTGTDT
jgi:hypothetical protein